MHRLKMAVAIAALALALPAAAAAATSRNPYLYEQGSASELTDQGSSPDYRSLITRVTPSVRGLGLQVLEFSDRLQLVNHTGKTITIYGYQNEPYARVLANGTVQLNQRSPAVYLNTNFYANVAVPASANPADPPQWTTIFKTGTFDWHDHRIHYMSPALPPQVKNKSKRTLIFNWTVPISVGAQRGTISGQLFWTPETSKASPLAYIVLGIVGLMSIALIFFVRHRRGPSPRGPGGTGESGSEARALAPLPPDNPHAEPREAW
jgi:hypothetical protein